jgi:hypothetical protein
LILQATGFGFPIALRKWTSPDASVNALDRFPDLACFHFGWLWRRFVVRLGAGRVHCGGAYGG